MLARGSAASARAQQCNLRSSGRGGSAAVMPRRAATHRAGRLVVVRVQAVADLVRTSGREAILCQKFTAHSASLAAAMVLEDGGEQLILGISLFLLLIVLPAPHGR
jgi:hypothetical protein